MPLSKITNPFLDPAGAARSNVYSPSANTIGIVTAGTERVRVDSSGNVLIGANSATVVYSGSSTVSSKVQSVSDYENFYATSINNNSNPAYNFAGKNSAGTVYRYAAIQAPFTTTTAGSEAGAIAFHTSLSGSNIAERVRIDASGRVTKPYQPSFVARFSGSSKDGSTISPIQFNTAPLNVGSCFNTSTYKFTAPVGGIYSFTAMPAYKESSQDFSWGFSINGGGVTSDNVRVLGSTPTSHSSWTGSLIINLAANDTVEIKFTSGTYHQNGAGLNYFSGILIG